MASPFIPTPLEIDISCLFNFNEDDQLMNFQYPYEDPSAVLITDKNPVVQNGGSIAVAARVVDPFNSFPPSQEIYQFEGDPSAVVNVEENTVLVQKGISTVAGVGVVVDHISSYFNSIIPIGFKFHPKDDELIDHYLKKRVLNQQLPMNRIPEVELYNYDPEYLTENYQPCGEREWYFFTPRYRKHQNGDRLNRDVGNGHWKATAKDKEVKSNGRHIGYKGVLVFYNGTPSYSEKTNWIMHEFRVKESFICRSSREPNDMKLDSWVLCKIYRTNYKSSKEACHAKGSREDVDTWIGNNDRSDGFDEDTGPAITPAGNLNSGEMIIHNKDQVDDPMGLVNPSGEAESIHPLHNNLPLLPSGSYPTLPGNFYNQSYNGFNSAESVHPLQMDDPMGLVNPFGEAEFIHPLHNNLPLLPSGSNHTLPDNIYYQSNIDFGYGYPSSLVEPNSFNPAMHYTDSNCQLRSSTAGFVNDDYRGFEQQNYNMLPQFDSFSKNSSDAFNILPFNNLLPIPWGCDHYIEINLNHNDGDDGAY